MKIRFDFVTNSSSSSFVVFNIKSPELADICEKYGVPTRITGDVLRDRWTSEDIVNLSRPNNGDIASWFIDLLNEEFMDLYHSGADIKGAVTEIKTKEKQINQNIGYATIEIADVCSDDGCSDYCCYEKKNGKIKVTGIDEDEWDYAKEGEALWEALSGDLSKVKKRANKNGSIIDELDLFWQYDSKGEPYEIKAEKKSTPKKTESSSISTEKSTSNRGKNKTNSKPSDKNNQAKVEITDTLNNITTSLDSILEQTKAMAEDARTREEKLIASGEKRPFKHKENDIVPDELLSAIKTKKTFGYSEYYHEELFEMYDKIIEISEADIDYIQWNTIKYAKEDIKATFEGLKAQKSLVHFSHRVESANDSITLPSDDDVINNDVSRPEDFVIKNGVLEGYKGTASFVDVPDGVVEIADAALGDTGFISEVNLPESLEIIGKEFINWSDCVELFIPKNVKAIHEKAFSQCRFLTDLSISKENKNYSVGNGVLFNKDKTELLIYLDGKKDRIYIVPEHVKVIGKSAFDRLYNSYSFSGEMLEKVIVPGNVEVIKEMAFAGLENLKAVEMRNGLKIIDKDVFKNCAKLEEVYIPASVEKLLVSAFTGCKSLNKIYISDKLTNEKVLINIEKIADKFNAEIIKTNKDASQVLKEISKPSVRSTSNNTDSYSVSGKKGEQPAIHNDVNNNLIYKNKAVTRIQELEKQIESNNSSSSNGSGLVVVGLLLVVFFMYCVIDSYNEYQISSAFYPSYYLSTDTITVSLVLLAISLIVVVLGFVKKSKGKKIKKLNIQLQEEINLLKDPQNHASYFENKNNKENENAK